MFNPWHVIAVLAAAGVAFAASVTFVLVSGADSHLAASGRAGQAAQLPDRTDCGQIFGTAYRSDNERRWFSENCSTWSQSIGDVPEPDAPAATPTPSRTTAPGPDGRSCDQVRGTPYRSDAERAWYRANCMGSASPQPAGGPDRTDCNEIRGTPYRSDAERAWYQANCLSQPTPGARLVTPTPQPPAGPGDVNGRGNGNGRGRR